jgi:hypothetical protein
LKKGEALGSRRSKRNKNRAKLKVKSLNTLLVVEDIHTDKTFQKLSGGKETKIRMC